MKFYSTKEAAEFCNVSLRTIKNWLKSNNIKAAKKGVKSAKFYSEKQLIALLKVQRPNENHSKSAKVQKCNSKSAISNPKSAILEKLGMQNTDTFQSNFYYNPAIKVGQAEMKIRAINDNAIFEIFCQSPAKYKAGYFEIAESKNNKKLKNCKMKVKLTYSGNPIRFEPLHLVILNICNSAIIEGTKTLTVDNIFRRMTGSHNRSRIATEDWRYAISEVLKDLCNTYIEIDISDIASKCKNYHIDEKIIKGKMLEATIKEDDKVYGMTATTITFKGETSPLYGTAESKNNRIMSFSNFLLDVPVKFSLNSILIRHYLLWRIQNHIQHAQQPVILFDTMFKVLNITFQNRPRKSEAIGSIKKMFDFWKECGLIKDWNITYQPNNPKALRGIEFKAEKLPRVIEYLKQREARKKKSKNA